jgi:hypothetical protein
MPEMRLPAKKAASSLQVDDRFLQMDVTDDTSIENAGSATCVMLKPSEKYHGRPSCVAE